MKSWKCEIHESFGLYIISEREGVRQENHAQCVRLDRSAFSRGILVT